MPRYLTALSILVLNELSVQTYRYRLTKPRNRICQIGDLGVCKRREYFRHDAVIAVSRIALVLAQSFREIVLALIGNVRNIFAASQIQTMTTVTAMRRDQGAAGLNARGIPGIRRHRRRRQLGDGTGKAVRRMSARNPSTISHIHRLIGASGSHAIKLVTVEVSAFRLSTLLRCRSLHTRKSAVGHSRSVHSAPVSANVRYASNSDH